MGKKREEQLKPDTLKIFADATDAKVKVIVSLHRKGYSIDQIYTATGVAKAEIKRVLTTKGLPHAG